MFQKIFNPDNALMITLAQIGDCVFLSLFWVLCCFPVLTIGASTTAMYDAVVHTFRMGDKYSWHRFLKTFRGHLRPALAPTAVFLPVFALWGWGMIQIWNRAVWGQISWMAFSAGAFVGVLVLGILSVMFPLLSRFETTFAALMKNTVLLGLANAPRTLLLGFVNAAVVILCVRFVIPLFFLPALAALIGTLFLEPMFRPYMPKEDSEE